MTLKEKLAEFLSKRFGYEEEALTKELFQLILDHYVLDENSYITDSINRDDVEVAGMDTAGVDESVVEAIANAIRYDAKDDDYWETIKIHAELKGLKEKDDESI